VHLAKPLTPEDVRNTVASIVELRALARAAGGEDTGVEPLAPRRLRILVAEDNELNEVLMRRLLGKRGHDVSVVADGRAVLALLEVERFDVLLLDIHLPGMNGFAVIEQIRSRERGGSMRLHVIATTARSRHEDREACLAAGMDDFLSKPLAAGLLWRALDRVVVHDPRSTLIDNQVLLAACGGDAGVLEKISATLRASLAEDLAAVRRAFEDRNAPRLSEAAHKLFGLVSPFSSVAGAMASELEARAKHGDLEEAASMLVSRLAALVPDLTEEVAALSLETLRAGRS